MEQQHNADVHKKNGLSLWKRLVLITALLCSGLSFSIALEVPVTHAQNVIVQDTKPHQNTKPRQNTKPHQNMKPRQQNRDSHNRDRHDRNRQH